MMTVSKRLSHPASRILVKNEPGTTIQGKLIWNKERTSVTFQPKEVLPPNSKLSAEVRVAFEELVTELGSKYTAQVNLP